MPTSKKGRLSGGARKEINERRSQEIVNAFLDKARGKEIKDPHAAEVAESVTFARVTKFVGANHIRVAIPGTHGPRELLARIPNLYAGRRGATPITTRDVVVLEVGPEFNILTYKPSSTDHFDIKAILDSRQASRLNSAGVIPDWMLTESTEGVTSGKGGVMEDGFVFADAEIPEEDDDEDADSSDNSGSKRGAFNRKTARDAAVGGAGTGDDDELDIDNI